MGVEVDSVIVDLEARIGQYRTDMREAIGLQRQYQEGWMAPANDSGPAQMAVAKKAAKDVGDAAEQSAQVVTKARKKRTDAERAAADEEKRISKDGADAVKAAERAKADAIKATEKAVADAQRAEQNFQKRQTSNAEKRYYAQGPNLFEAGAKEANARALADQVTAEKAAIDQVAAYRRQAAEDEDRLRQATLTNTRRDRNRQAQEARQPAPRPNQGFIGPLQQPITEPSAYSGNRQFFRSDGTPFDPTPRTFPGNKASDAISAKNAQAAKDEAAAEVAALEAEEEKRAVLATQLVLRSRLAYASKEEAQIARDIIADLRLEQGLRQKGIADEQILVELEGLRLARTKFRAEQEDAADKKAGAAGAHGSKRSFGGQVLEGATLGYAPTPGVVTGIAIAAGVGASVEAVASATEYAKALSDVSKEAGISTDALQVYQRAAVNAGAKSTDFDMAISALSNNLGKARTGSEEQAKAFAALGISFKGTATAGQLLPTIIERLSSIADQSKRATVETTLFNEAGRKLDGVFAGGNQRISELAAGLERTGAILSSSDIAKLNDTADKLAAVKAQLQVDLAQVVAGNADSILKLAAAFATLVDDVKDAVSALEHFNQTQGHSGLINTDFLAKPEPAKAQSFGDYLYSQISRASGAATGFLRGRIAGKLPAAQSNSLDQLSGSAHDFTAAQPGKVNDKLLDSLNAPKGRKPRGPSPEALANEADERTKRFNDIIARYQDQQLAAVAEQTADEETRRDQQRSKIAADRDRDIKELQTQAGIDARKKGADEDLIQARLAQAIAARRGLAVEQTNVVNLEGNASAIDRDVETQNAILEFKNQQLQAQEQLAKTDADRRDLELQILANEQQIAANSANGVLRKAAQGVPTSDADIAAANRTIANLPASTASQTALIDKQTQGPLASYIDSLPKSAKEVDEAFQGAAVHGLQSFNTQLDDSISKLAHLHGIAGQFLDDIVQIGIKWAEAQLFGGGQGGGIGGLFGGYNSAAGNVLNGGKVGGGGGLGGLLGSLGKLVGIGGGINPASLSSAPLGLAGPSISGFGIDPSLLALPGLAGGGSFQVAGNGGTDRNVLSINGQPVRRVNMGEQINVVPVNSKVNSAPASSTVLHQTIQYSGAVDIADKPYVNQMASVLASQTRAAIAQGDAQTLRQSPGAVRQAQVLKG